MLSLAARRAATTRILYPNADRTSASTLKVIVFGSSSQIAPYLASHLNTVGAYVTFPCRTSYKYVDNVKAAGSFRNMHIAQFIDYSDRTSCQTHQGKQRGRQLDWGAFVLEEL